MQHRYATFSPRVEALRLIPKVGKYPRSLGGEEFRYIAVGAATPRSQGAPADQQATTEVTSNVVFDEVEASRKLLRALSMYRPQGPLERCVCALDPLQIL
jgi:hypothetical protein